MNPRYVQPLHVRDHLSATTFEYYTRHPLSVSRVHTDRRCGELIDLIYGAFIVPSV